MNLAALRASFRSDAFDEVTPYGFSDASVNGWLNEAQEEAVIRKDLLLETEDADLCEIAATAGTLIYTLDPTVLRVANATWLPEDSEDDPLPLKLIDRIELTRLRPDWRTTTDVPEFAMVEDTTLRLGCIPDTDGTINLEVYRLPITMTQDTDSPEIAAAHHRHLVHWALHRAFGRRDGELFDQARADRALTDFERYFGPRPDADRMRRGEEQPHFTKAWV